MRPVLLDYVYSHTSFLESSSMKRNECEQLFCDPPWFVNVFTVKSKGEEGYGIREFFIEWWIPCCIRFNQSKEEVQKYS